MKLKIGTGTSKKKQKPKQEKEDDYFSDLSDEEIEAIQVESFSEEEIGYSDLKVLKDSIDTEVKESVQTALDIASKEETKETLKEVIEIPEDIKEEKEIKEAVNGVFILDEVGIGIKYAEKYASLFPKKKVVYRGLFTKAFLKWYITNAKVSKLKDLYIIESEYVKTEQKDEIMKWIVKRLKAPVELEDVEKIPIVESGAGLRWELETQKDIDMYEFLLGEKWDFELSEERAKGITQLDAMLEEQMRVQKLDMTNALKYLITGFHLEAKWYSLSGILTNLSQKKEEIIIKEVIEKIEPNVDSNAEKIREIDRSIKRFHHIKFLYELMGSPKMKLVGDLSDEEFEHIQKIDHLLNDREELKIEEKQKTKRGVKYGKLIR